MGVTISIRLIDRLSNRCFKSILIINWISNQSGITVPPTVIAYSSKQIHLNRLKTTSVESRFWRGGIWGVKYRFKMEFSRFLGFLDFVHSLGREVVGFFSFLGAAAHWRLNFWERLERVVFLMFVEVFLFDRFCSFVLKLTQSFDLLTKCS